MQPFNAQDLQQIWQPILKSEVPSDAVISRISTDTRTMAPSDCFFAVSGAQFDGHDYCNQAMDKGASLAIVERKQPIDIPQIVVENTRVALGLLAAEIRRKFSGKVIALTGSAGKTTTKQMIAAICQQVGKTHVTPGNFNNDLGVPFTWFALPEDCQYAVIEMGANHQGEIAYLSAMVRPDVGLVVNAGRAHLEGFGGLDGVAKGKGELFVSLKSNQTAVINADDHYASWWHDMASNAKAIITFSAQKHADIYASDIDGQAGTFVLHYGAEQCDIQLPAVGIHNVHNALAAAAAAFAVGLPINAVQRGLAVFVGEKGRQQRIALSGLTVIDDSYNANPESLQSGIATLAYETGYRVAVLGDMAELGADEVSIHAKLGRALTEQADAFLCTGPLMQAFAEHNDRAKWFADKAALLTTLIALIDEKRAQQTPITIMIKGSRSSQMETIVSALSERYSESIK